MVQPLLSYFKAYDKEMRIQEWGYENEQSFVRDAMVSPEKRRDFKRFNILLVEKIALKYIQQDKLNKDLQPILVNVGLNTFDHAFNKYIQLTNAHEKGKYLFSTYYINWVRKAMEAYLENVSR